MDTFFDLEEKFKHTPVHIHSTTSSGAGFITLARKDTEVVLSTVGSFRARHAANGWFDVDLQTNSGVPIWLHNALITQSSGPNRRLAEHQRRFEDRIFPNLVVVGSHESTARAVGFRVSGANAFFYYELIEWMGERTKKVC
jgi:hypothetical protein